MEAFFDLGWAMSTPPPKIFFFKYISKYIGTNGDASSMFDSISLWLRSFNNACKYPKKKKKKF